MKEYIITQSVLYQRVILVVRLEGAPVIIEFLRTEHKHRLVSVLVVFDNAQSSKGLTQTYRVSKDAAIVLFKFVDDGKGSILLEVIKFVPDDTVLKTSSLIGQYIFIDVIKEFIEYVVKRDEVDELRSILIIDRFNVLQHLRGYIFELI